VLRYNDMTAEGTASHTTAHHPPRRRRTPAHTNPVNASLLAVATARQGGGIPPPLPPTNPSMRPPNPSNPDPLLTPDSVPSAVFPPPNEAGYAGSDGRPAAECLNPEEDMGRKRTKAAGRYQPESSWRLNRTVFNTGVTASGAGTILYKGKDVASGKHKFLLRHQWYAGTDRKTASKQITAANASEAERQLNVWVQQARSGRIVPRVPVDFADYVEVTWVTQRRPRLAGATIKGELRVWNGRIKPFLGELRIHELTRDVMSDWVAKNASGPILRRQVRRRNGTVVERERQLSRNPRTVKNAKALLTTIVNDLVEGGYLAQSPMPRPPRRKSRKEKVQAASATVFAEDEYWTRDEVSEFWEKGLPVAQAGARLEYPCLRKHKREGAEPRFHRMDPYGATMTFLFGAFCLAFGTRPGEACAARWQDLTRTEEGSLLDVSAAIGVPDADQLILANCPRWDRTLTKTGVKATVSDTTGFVDRFLLPFRTEQKRLMAEGKLQNPNGYIFVRTDGSFCNPDLMRVKWGHLLTGLGLRVITPYGLRHTHATLLLEDGVSISAISARLRHADVMVTATVYAHVTARLEQRTAGRVTAAGLVPPVPSHTVPVEPTSSPVLATVPQNEAMNKVAIGAVPDQVVSLDAWRQRKGA
jgi:integrase